MTKRGRKIKQTHTHTHTHTHTDTHTHTHTNTHTWACAQIESQKHACYLEFFMSFLKRSGTRSDFSFRCIWSQKLLTILFLQYLKKKKNTQEYYFIGNINFHFFTLSCPWVALRYRKFLIRKQKDFPNFLELSAEPVHQVFLGFVKPIFDHRQFLALVQRT